MDKKIKAEKPLKILRGFLTAWILTAAGIACSGLVTLLTPADTGTGSHIIVGAAAVGGFLCGSAVSSAVGSRGLIVGFISGIILSLTLLLSYLLFFGTAADASLNYLPLIFPAAASAAGGLFGVSGKRSVTGEKKSAK